MRIPEGHGQVTWFFSGDAVPTSAAVTCGFFNAIDQAASACAIELGIQWENEMTDLYTDELALVAVRVKLGPNVDGPMAEVIATGLGTASGTAVPPNTALCVRKNTNVGGREGQGRFFIPGIPEASVDQSGQLEAGYATAAQSVCTSFLASCEANDLPLEVLHNSNRSPSGITTLSVQSRVATQRRRLRR